METIMTVYFAEALLNASDIGFSGATSDGNVLKNVLFTVYFWAGFIAVAVLVVAGFYYALSNAEPANVTRAKNAILYSLIGLVIIFLAFAITNIILGALK